MTAEPNGLYHQVFDREIDASGFTTYQDALSDDWTLNQVRDISHSTEAQSELDQIYQEVLGRDADPDGLTNYQDELGSWRTLDEIRSVIAHSPDAQSHLTRLFQDIVGRAPGAAELVGMEDQLTTPDTAQETLISALSSSGSAGGYMLIIPDIGSTALTALQDNAHHVHIRRYRVWQQHDRRFRSNARQHPAVAYVGGELRGFAEQDDERRRRDRDHLRLDPRIRINGAAASTLGPNNFVIV